MGPVAIWTDGTTTAVFHPMSEPMALADTNKVRVAFALSEITTNARARPALRFSNDGVTWDSAQPIDNSTLPYVITETITFGSGYVDLNTAPVTGQKSWVQFGVQAANSSAGAIGFGNATLRIEVRRGE